MLPKRILSIQALLIAEVLGFAFLGGHAEAAPIQVVTDTINMFRDTRSANNVGVQAGDRVQYGADIVGGSTGTSLSAFYATTNFTAATQNCTPLAVDQNFCAGSMGFSSNRIADTWTIRFSRPGENDVVVNAPSLAQAGAAVPFPVNVMITGTGTTPTLTWTVPGGFVPDAFRVVVFDNRDILPNGQANAIHSVPIPATSTSYTIPATLSSGRSLELGGRYTLALQLIDTRNDPSIFNSTNNNAEILRRSYSFFNFTPLASGQQAAFLPTVSNNVYNFNIQNVGPNSVTFIDPFVAVGYDYQIGAGDPNFASVLLPTGIGDNLFDLFLWNGTSFYDTGIDLTGGAQYFFGGLGVDRFSIRGIETSAGLDPNNVTAFITGLTFVNQGNFTGTMTPITVEVTVPEPSTAFLLLGALTAFAAFRRVRVRRR